MKLKTLSVILLFCLLTMDLSAQGLFGLFGSSQPDKKIRVKFVEGDEDAKDEILLITIKGAIYERDEEESMPFKIEKDLFENLKKDLEVARKRKAVKAILLEINSPGGEVTASDIVYHQLKKVRNETEKPIIAIIGTMGASGAYYVACAADKIMAHPTSIIGSIGVLMQSINVEELAEKVGIKAVSLKSDKTPMKDILSPFRKMTEEEQKMLMSVIESVYERFVKIVGDSRKMKREEVIKVADGGIYSSEKAKELNLIDDIGYREDAMNKAMELANMKSAALVKRVTRKSFSEILAGMSEMNSFMPSLRNELKKLLIEGNQMQMLFK